jgi:hypothetical protein
LGSPNLLNETYQSLRLFHIESFSLAQMAQFVHVEQIAFVAWFGWKFLQPRTAKTVSHPDVETTILLDRYCDLLSLMLIIGPSVLADHYVMAIPISLWTLITSFKRAPARRPYGAFAVAETGALLVLSWSFKSIVPVPLQPLGLVLLSLARAL